MIRSNLRRSIGLGTGLMAGLAIAVFALAGSDKKPQEPVKAITGTVRDATGKPIAGAEVWLPVTMSYIDEDTSHAVTDAQGRYTLKVPDSWEAHTPAPARVDRLGFAPGHQIATASAHEALSGKTQSVDMTLGPATDTSFMVLGPDGRPVAGAIVEPFHFKTPMAYNFPPRNHASRPSGDNRCGRPGESSRPAPRGIHDRSGHNEDAGDPEATAHG